MITLDELKTLLHETHSATDKLFMLLAHIGQPCKVTDLARVSKQAGFDLKKISNPTSLLAQSKGRAIQTSEGWELAPKGIKHLESKGIVINAVPTKVVAADLRNLLAGITDFETVRFLEEAIGCCEARLYRAAVVMSWSAAAYVLQRHVMDKHLSTFNSEMLSTHPKWTNIRDISDFSTLKESEFLLRTFKISIIDKSQRKVLEECLDRRNQCGHPSSFRVGENTVRHHIEVLISNIFQPFAK